MPRRRRIMLLLAVAALVAACVLVAVPQLTPPLSQDTASNQFMVSSIRLVRVGDEVIYTYKAGGLVKAWKEEGWTWMPSGEWGFFIMPPPHKTPPLQALPLIKGENWDLTIIDGREAFIARIPDGYRLGFFIQEKVTSSFPFQRQFEIVKDIWMRLNFKFIEGKPQIIKLLIRYEGDVFESLYIIDESTAERYGRIEGHLTYVWNSSEWCTVTVSCAEIKDSLLYDAGIRMYVDEADGNVTLAVGTEGTMVYKPSAILTFEVANKREEPIVGLRVRVGSDESYVALTKPIGGGKKHIVRFAPTGNFEVGRSYNVVITTIYKGGRALSQQFSVNCAAGG